jgi:hypothetical protein
MPPLCYRRHRFPPEIIRLGAGQKERPNIPKNCCRTTIAERMVETPVELPFIGDQVVCLSHDQAARSGPRKEARPPPVLAEKLEPGSLRRKLRHLAQLLLVNQNRDSGPGPRREWGPGPPQIAAPVGEEARVARHMGAGSRRGRGLLADRGHIRLPPSARRARRAPRGPKAALARRDTKRSFVGL